MARLVMVIDDSLTVRKIMEATLQREGFNAVSYPDGLEAMHALERQEIPVPDLIFLDVALPKMDGYAIARALRQKNRLGNTAIIMLSGRDGVFDKLRGRVAGAREYMTKPFKTDEVIALLHRYLGVQEALISW